MLLSFGTTLGLTSYLLGETDFIEGFFGVMIFGLGVDFGLHLLVRMREEHQKYDFETALLNTILAPVLQSSLEQSRPSVPSF